MAAAIMNSDVAATSELTEHYLDLRGQQQEQICGCWQRGQLYLVALTYI